MTETSAKIEANRKTQAHATMSTMAIIKRLVGYMMVGSDKRRFLIGMVPRIGIIACIIFVPFATGKIVNEISAPNNGGNMDGVRPWAIGAAVASALIILLSLYTQRLYSRLATNAIKGIQVDISKAVQRLSLDFFDRQPIGELTSRITNDSEIVALFYIQAISQFIVAALQIVMVLAIMLAVNVKLTLVSMIIVPIMGITLFVVQRLSGPAFTMVQERLGVLSGYQEETISGNKVIISNRRRDWAEEQHEELVTDVFLVAAKAFLITAIQQPLVQALVVLQTAFLLMVGGLMVISGGTDLGTLTMFAGFVSLFTMPMGQMANLTGTILNAVAGGRRVFEIMDEVPKVKDADDAAEFEFAGGEIVFDDVDFSYVPGRKILKHNSFTIKPGERIGICGPTGAGKSTIMNILTRYYDLDAGTITIDGQNITGLSQRSLRGEIGAVLQEPFLFTDSVMNNLLYARDGATKEECIEAAKQANAHDFIMDLANGYDTLLTERGSNLSSGQRQMITIARAMLANPKILILDEATSNVDTRTEKLINEGLSHLMQGRTSFSIAHRLSTIRDSDRIMVLNGGEIVEFASHDDLMEMKGFYYALYMSQFKSLAPTDSTSEAAAFINT